MGYFPSTDHFGILLSPDCIAFSIPTADHEERITALEARPAAGGGRGGPASGLARAPARKQEKRIRPETSPKRRYSPPVQETLNRRLLSRMALRQQSTPANHTRGQTDAARPITGRKAQSYEPGN